MDSPVVQIKKYLYALYGHRYLFLLIAVTTALAIVVGSFFTPKKYEAKSTVFIEKNVLDSLMKGLTVSPSMGDRIRILRYHMLSRDMIVRVLKKMNMDVKAGSDDAFEALVRDCQDRTQISLRGNDLFFVSIVDSKPEFAKDFINALVNTYVEENLAAKREESFGANRFLSEQVAFYKKKLDEIEDKIYNFRKKTGIFSAVSETSLMDEIKTHEEEIKLLRLQKNEQSAKLKTMGEQLRLMRNSSRGGGAQGISGGLGDGLRIEALQAKVEEMLLIYNNRYPAVVKLREQIAELEKRQSTQPNRLDGASVEAFNPSEDPVFVDLKMRMNLAQSDFNAMQAREAELLSQIENNKRILQNYPQDKKVLADLERERNMNRSVYESLLERVGVSEVSKQMEVADKATTFRIVDPAILPTQPVGSKRLFKMLLGLMVGIGAGVAAVVVREKLDDSVKDADTLRTLGLTVLAEIPLMFDEQQAKTVRRKDRWVYSYSGVCLVLIGVMIGHDLLGLTLLDQFIAYVRLDTLVSGVLDMVR